MIVSVRDRGGLMRLGIPRRRRVAGLSIFGIATAMGLVIVWEPGFAAQWIVEMKKAFLYPEWLLLGGDVVCWPTIIYPLLFDRFPKWVEGMPSFAHFLARQLLLGDDT